MKYKVEIIGHGVDCYVHKIDENQLRNLIDNEIESGMVSVFVLPFDIESVVYGRGVGYTIEELTPPDEIAQISATKIREKLSNGL
jgi:hypothetical protein